MKSTPARYWAATQDPASERRRLELLEARYDPLTFRRLDALGPSVGCSVLEVGAGAGSVTRFLAERVGPAGRVVATDIDLRFLLSGERLPSNVEMRQHDIVTDPLEPGAFDLVHCRALLCHLDEPEVALTRMASSLRPGGWLLVEDADYITLEATCPDHPLTPAWTRAARRIIETKAFDSFVDPHLGRRLPDLLAKLGLHERSHEGTVRVHQGGSPSAEFLRHSFAAWRAGFETAIVIDDADLDGLISAFGDPSFSFVDSISYAAWRRR
jgi:SAM-dependent methyltransferase